jgi:hypothetical protein
VNTDEAFAARGRDLLARMEEWNKQKEECREEREVSDARNGLKQKGSRLEFSNVRREPSIRTVKFAPGYPSK